jgi:hypothetical protein
MEVLFRSAKRRILPLNVGDEARKSDEQMPSKCFEHFKNDPKVPLERIVAIVARGPD